MSGESIQGLAEFYAALGRLPDAARDELKVGLAIIAREGLAAQKAATPVGATGELQAGLTLQMAMNELQVRFGLLGLKRGRSHLFYGLIIYTGRKAQTVLVQRRRRVNGRLRTLRRRKVREDIVATYPLKVTARAAIPFIDAPGADFADDAMGQVAEYWSRTLNRAGLA